MKNVCVGIVIGVIITIGGVIIYNKVSNPIMESTITSSNTGSIITDDKIIIKKDGGKALVSCAFTDKLFDTTYTNNITLDMDKLQYNHSVSVGVGYFMQTELLYASLRYSYKSFGIGVGLGYSNEIKKIDYSLELLWQKRW